MSLTTPSQIKSIQALRGVAALAVALLHLAGLQMLEGLRADTGLYRYGWLGVDVFFIISGFIMVWVTRNMSGSPQVAGRFLLQRAVRIFPLWWVCVSFVGLFFFVIHQVPASPDVIAREQAWGYYLRSLFLLPQERAPLLTEGWTLIHELFFYIVFAAVLAVKMRKHIVPVLLLWGAVTALGFHLGAANVNPVLSIIFSPLSFLFIAGALIGVIKTPPALARFSGWALLAALIWVAALLVTGTLDKSARVLQLIAPLSLLLWSVVTLEQSGNLEVWRPLVSLGDISYALYLTHPLVILAWRVVRPFYKDGLFWGGVSGLPNSALLYVDMVVLLIAFLITAFLFHKLIEKPSLRFFKGKLKSYKKA